MEDKGFKIGHSFWVNSVEGTVELVATCSALEIKGIIYQQFSYKAPKKKYVLFKVPYDISMCAGNRLVGLAGITTETVEE